MPKTMTALVAETNALMRLFDAVADTSGADLTVWEEDQPAAVDVLYAWAHDRGLTVNTKQHPSPYDDTKRDTYHYATVSGGRTITVYEKSPWGFK